MSRIIYKIVPAELWRDAEKAGVFHGAGIDLADGFIHLSSASQVRTTAGLYFRGVENLLLVGLDSAALGDKLVWEASRDGALFPHLHGALDPRKVVSVTLMPVGPDGLHVFGEEIE